MIWTEDGIYKLMDKLAAAMNDVVYISDENGVEINFSI